MGSALPIVARKRGARGRGRFCAGAFSLMELMIAMTLLAILSTAVISAYLFMGRNLERLMSAQKQGVNGRRALQQFVTDVSSAVSFSSATSTNLTFTTATSGTLSNCTTTLGSTTVTCDSTSILTANMTISGTDIPSTATVSSVTNGTTFVLSTAATKAHTGLSLLATGGGSTVTYLYNSGSSPATLTRTAGGVTTTLLTDINTAATTPTNGFAFYDENGNSVSGTSTAVKMVEFAFSTTSGNATIGTQSNYVVVSPRVTLRNKALLK